MTAMEGIAGVTIAAATEMPRFEDGFINPQEVLRQLAESVVSETVSAEADQLREATGNSRNGYRGRRPTTCVGVLTLRIPKLRVESFFPDGAIERIRAAGSRATAKRVARIVAPVFRLKEAGAVRAAYHMAIEMLEGCCPDAAAILEEAEPDALAYLDFPASRLGSWRPTGKPSVLRLGSRRATGIWPGPPCATRTRLWRRC